MTPAQIEGFIDRICGLFPTSQIGRNTVKNAWTADDLLLLQDVDDARKVVPLIMEHHDKFPNLKEVHKAFALLRKPATEQTIVVCEICDGNGWDNGRRWNYNAKELICEGFTKTVLGRTYTYVVPCKCREFGAA
jgi:hypothetical protein